MDTKKLEKSLEDVYKNAPALPKSAKDWLVTWLPWINLVGGAFALLGAYWLWQWAHAVNKWADYVNTLNSYYGTGTVVSSRMSFVVWLSLAVAIVTAVIYIMAFNPLRSHKMSGWRLLFLALLVNVVSGLIMSLTDYATFGNFFGNLVISVIGLYFLFQIKGEYSKSVEHKTAEK